MEKLINSLPKEKISTVQKTGEIIHQGLCLRFSTGRQKWVCGYGNRPFKLINLNKYYVEADDPVEALAFFVELLDKQSNT